MRSSALERQLENEGNMMGASERIQEQSSELRK